LFSVTSIKPDFVLKLDVLCVLQSQNVIAGGGSFPVSNQFMIGDYVMPGNVVMPDQYHEQQYKSEST